MFKEARKAGKKALWKIERATYCLYIDNININKTIKILMVVVATPALIVSDLWFCALSII